MFDQDDLFIRQETPFDRGRIDAIHRKVFGREREAELIEALRRAGDYLPNLSLVAQVEDDLVGHVLFTPVRITAPDGTLDALALAPLAVLPDYQRKGIGTRLVEEGLALGRKGRYALVLAIGIPEYFSTFGFERASSNGIRFSFDVPDAEAMVLPLSPGILEHAKGIAIYPDAFSVS